MTDKEYDPYYASDGSVKCESLRDMFAAKAMASVPLALDSNEQQLIANAAYAQADAMLRAREK
ncbi:hypothetical protein ABM053_19155 [Morganella morganii]|uniref:hypothetical protein n=1 Tax=Morganella morganii TaxID=582 RepID=UPI00280EA8FB|nr:hypothetical protein [Morganella morganii]